MNPLRFFTSAGLLLLAVGQFFWFSSQAHSAQTRYFCTDRTEMRLLEFYLRRDAMVLLSPVSLFEESLIEAESKDVCFETDDVNTVYLQSTPEDNCRWYGNACVAVGEALMQHPPTEDKGGTHSIGFALSVVYTKDDVKAALAELPFGVCFAPFQTGVCPGSYGWRPNRGESGSQVVNLDGKGDLETKLDLTFVPECDVFVQGAQTIRIDDGRCQ